MDKKITAILIILSIPFAYIIRGFVLSTMWGWFLVPLGLIQIGKAHAVGVAVIVSLITYVPSQCKDEREGDDKVISYIAYSFASPFLVLLIGYIAKQFM